MVQVHRPETPLNITHPDFTIWRKSLVSEKESATGEKAREANWSNAIKLLCALEATSPEDGDQLYRQSFEMANILASLEVSNNTLIAAVLYPFVNAELLNLDSIKEKCSAAIAKQLSGVITMDAIRTLQSDHSDNHDASHIDNLRKMLLVMVDDVRVVLIKLAERLYFLREAVGDSEPNREKIAREINEVYAPLANRLGVGQIKWEMEDLAFRILNRKDYIAIAKSLDEKRVARENYVNSVLSAIEDALKPLQVTADLQGRAKHIYSIWKKMQRKQVGFEEIYDVRAVRILVDKIQDCYSVLGIVHGLWKHIPKEFDDYVATPKENGYRSLHTAVIGPEGKTLEIQIRTFEMHQESELGVAAHWKYKEGKGGPSDGYEAKIAWLRQLLEWQEEVTESAHLVDEFRNQVLEERVYVFTPKGRLIDLPKGATALDFAYRVHTEVGHRCRGAKADGRIITLTQPLQTGQKIEVLTSKTGGPSRDWLIEHYGYIRSSRARHKVHQWFRLQNKDKNAAAGKLMLERELQKHKLSGISFGKIASQFNYPGEEELFAGIGAGDKGLHQVINTIRSLQDAQPTIDRNTVINKQPRTSKRSVSSDILVEGVANLLTRMAGCCKPLPGDEIAGYVTQSRGIMVHRADCRYLLASQQSAPEKVLKVTWSDSVNEKYLIDLLIKAYDRQGLLGDVTTLLAEEKVSVTSLKTHVNKKRLMVSIHLQIELASIGDVARIMTRVEQLPTIVSVQRK